VNGTESIITINTLSDFSIQLAGTLLGVLFGFGLAFWYDRKKKHQHEQEIKQRTIEAIKEELLNIQKPTVKKALKWTDQGFEGDYFIIRTPVIDSSINSGNFSLFPPPLQTEIDNVYLTIKSLISMTDRILDFYTTSVFVSNKAEEQAEKLLHNYKDKRNDINDAIDKFLTKLDKKEIQL